MTLALGLLVATLTLILARNQITQLRQASREQQEAKDFARSIFDSQSNDILVVNNDGELLAVNQAFLNISDFRSRSEFTGLPRGAPAPAGGSGIRRQSVGAAGRQFEPPRALEVKPQDGRNGDTRLFDVYASPLTIGGQTGGRVVAILDVTEAEKVREELRRSRTLSAVGQITATVAHELYNPIGAVKLNLDLLEMPQTSGRRRFETYGRPAQTRRRAPFDHRHGPAPPDPNARPRTSNDRPQRVAR